MIATQSKSSARNFASAFEYNHNKLTHKEVDKRAVLLDHNFNFYGKSEVLAELKLLKELRPKVNRDGFHVSISFSPEDRRLGDKDLSRIAIDYMKAMGFSSDNHLYAVWRHEDGVDEEGNKHKHQHIHILCTTIGFDGSIVNLGNNYWKSQKVTRELEKKYNLVQVKPKNGILIKSPSKNEIEMVLRTRRGSSKMMLQEKLLSSLEASKSLDEFIANCKDRGVYLLFNQSKNGYVSGLTYVMDDGFIANASKIGQSFKWNSLKNSINYEQTTQSETISRTNIDTRERFKDLFERRDRESERYNANDKQAAKQAYSKSNGYSTSNGIFKQERDHSRFEADSSRNSRNIEVYQINEEAFSDKLFTRSSALISSIGSLFNSSVAPIEDEEELRNNRRKRRR